MWDVGGQQSLRSYWRNYFESTDGLAWVVDSSDRERVLLCGQQLRQMLQEERLMGVSLLVFANKQDIPGSLTADQVTELLRLHEVTSHRWRVVACSAYSGDNLQEGIEWLVNDVSGRIFSLA